MNACAPPKRCAMNRGTCLEMRIGLRIQLYFYSLIFWHMLFKVLHKRSKYLPHWCRMVTFPNDELLICLPESKVSEPSLFVKRRIRLQSWIQWIFLVIWQQNNERVSLECPLVLCLSFIWLVHINFYCLACIEFLR